MTPFVTKIGEPQQDTGPWTPDALFRRAQQAGASLAVYGGKLESAPKDIDTIESAAKAAAVAAYREPYAPDRLAHDVLRESEFRKILTDRKFMEDAEKFAIVRVRDNEK